MHDSMECAGPQKHNGLAMSLAMSTFGIHYEENYHANVVEYLAIRGAIKDGKGVNERGYC